MAFSAAASLHASAAETGSGVGANVDLGVKSALELVLATTVVAGTTPTLDLSVESSADGTTGWRTVETFERITAVGTTKVVATGCDRYARVRWVIGGTLPSFTFSVAGLAILVYASPDDFEVHGLPASATLDVPIATQHKHLKASTSRIDGALQAGGWVLPLTSWDDDIRRDCCVIAAFDMLTNRGVDPDTVDGWIRLRYQELVGQPGQRGELDKIAARQRIPPNLIDSTPDEDEGGAYITTDAPRGW